jgi:hypothetical protein
LAISAAANVFKFSAREEKAPSCSGVGASNVLNANHRTEKQLCAYPSAANMKGNFQLKPDVSFGCDPFNIRGMATNSRLTTIFSLCTSAHEFHKLAKLLYVCK